MSRKVEKVIRALRKHSISEDEMLTLLMHVAAVLFKHMEAREGKAAAAASLVDWFRKIAAMADGNFDTDSSKN